MATQDQELEPVDVSGRNRFPSVTQRASRAKETLSPGTVAPSLQAIFNPTLFRERLDTNALMDSTFGQGGAFGDLERTNPALLQSIKDQAENPMTPAEHRQFRSSILGMVSAEAEKQQKIETQLSNNTGYMEALSVMDAALPGVRDPSMQTYEEQERKQIGLLYQQAQRTAQLDPAASAEIMAEVRKRGDALTANTRQAMEQTRKRATIEDVALYSASDNAMQLLRDAAQDLNRAIESGEPVPEFVLQKALQAYGAAGSAQATSLGDVAASALGGSAGGAGAGSAGGVVGAVGGAVVGGVTGGVGALASYFKDKKKVIQLAQSLHDAGTQVAVNYNNNRAKLQERYKPLGIKFGAQQGEVYAVIADTYNERADALPTKESSPEQDAADKETTLRNALTEQVASSSRAVASVKPNASAGLPQADQRLQAASEKSQAAQDDLTIFNADMAEAKGQPAPADAADTVKAARARRQQRLRAAQQLQAQKGINDSLRGYLR